MREFKGTPGPWSFDAEYYWVDSAFSDSVIIGGSQRASVEDMQLIAATPELLEVLQEILRDNTIVHSQRIKANSIIAKALGD